MKKRTPPGEIGKPIELVSEGTTEKRMGFIINVRHEKKTIK
jgi:hypothetical protein